MDLKDFAPHVENVSVRRALRENAARFDLMTLPPELLRKGRFDEIFFVDLPTASERSSIFAVHLNLRNLDPADFDLQQLVEASDGYSGAEIEQAIIGAMYSSLQDDELPSTKKILEELAAMVPLSVSRREDVARIRQLAREWFVPASSQRPSS